MTGIAQPARRYEAATADEDMAWKEHAACASVPDRELFFPTRGESATPAKLICRRCAVRFECLEYALAHGEKFGVWGGTSERERRNLRRTRRRVAS